MAYANPFQPPSPIGTSGMGGDETDFYYQNVPEAGWWRQLFNWQPGTGEYWGMGNRARYAQNQFGRYQNVFNVQAAADPNLQWYDWLQGQKDPGAEYETLGPDQRGEGAYRSYTPRSRWNMGGY
jgi:hypothetical protein